MPIAGVFGGQPFTELTEDEVEYRPSTMTGIAASGEKE